MDIKFKLTEKERKKLEEKVKDEYGRFAGRLVNKVHNEIINRTPMNSGRTLASWNWSMNKPEPKDAGEPLEGGYLPGFYEGYTPTNNLIVGQEPGREFIESYPNMSMSRIVERLRIDPKGVAYICNGARTDSLYDSTLEQGVGSRAAHMNAGNIPGYNVALDIKKYFDPRGFRFFEQAESAIRNTKKI